MGVEIERRFLVANEDWKLAVTQVVRIRDGLLAMGEGTKVRVRITDDAAYLTLKGPRQGLRRAEFEYEIPVAEAAELLRDHGVGPVLEKTRFYVSHGGHVWHVDVYDGLLAGVVIAEIELGHEDEDFVRPGWVGREISGDPRYSKISLFRERTAALAARAGAAVGEG